MNCIKKIKIEDTIYEANVYFKNVIKCDEIARDNSIGDFERILGIICTIFGPSALDNPNHYEKLLKWVLKYSLNGEEKNNDEPDMDFKEDYNLIWASFMSDYNGMDIDKEQDMDWHKFIDLMNGLSNSEMGNCCVLNRIRNLRNFDLSTIKDNKERQKIAKLKEKVSLKKNENLTQKQEESMKEFYKSIGL